VVLQDRVRLVCLPGCRLSRLRGKELPHFTVFPMFNCYGHAPPPFVVVLGLSGAQARFAAIHRRKAHITHSPSGWVTCEVFLEWAGWVCQWLNQYREEHRLAGRTAVVFLDNAPTRGSRAAMHFFRTTCASSSCRLI
jgi:hypothetical protein